MTGILPAVEVSTGMGWGGTVAWLSAVAVVVLLGVVAWWVARPARRPPRRTYRVPPQASDRQDNERS